MKTHMRIPFLTREVPRHRMRESLAASLLLMAALLVVGCETAPTAPATAESDDPTFALNASKATIDRQDFQQTIPAPGIPAPSPCLGGTFFITGTISGWSQIGVTPNGHRQITEHIDFSQLTGSFDGRTWTAEPGSHEIWSVHLPPFGDAARSVVHEGRTRFVADDGGDPRVTFVHRIHRLVLPSGDLQHNDVTFEALCVGSGASAASHQNANTSLL